jgi:hypothetical protein
MENFLSDHNIHDADRIFAWNISFTTRGGTPTFEARFEHNEIFFEASLYIFYFPMLIENNLIIN